MERKDVLVPQADLDRQREFEEKIRAMFAAREAHPIACVDTFGCQQNVADGQRLMGMLAVCGFTFTDDPREADLVILNTCAVREHAEDRVFGNLGALTHTKKENPEQVIALCGCMAQEPRVSERIKRSYPHVDLVFGPHALWRFPELLWQVYETRKRVFSVRDEHGTIAEGIPVVRERGVKAWVSIMYGCNNFCSYCIVPYVRGRERSRDPQAVLAEVRELVEAGYKDITLLGQNVNSYGNDLDLDYHFPDLLADIDKIPGEYLIRFMSSHPKDATKRLFDVMAASPHVAKQLHLPFQSGNDRVLREMNRRYTRQQYLDLVNYAKSVMPGLVLTSDVIIASPARRRPRPWTPCPWWRRWALTPCSPSSTPPGPAPRRRRCRTRPPGRRSRSGSTSSWRSRTTCPPSSTPPTWERPCGCWWTARATIRNSPSPPGRRATAWCG